MIQGMDALEKQLDGLAKADYLPALEKALREVVLPEMQALTPVDKGDLLASENVVRDGDTVSLIAGTDHAVFVEFGTVHQAAQPFMRPAIDTKKNEALKMVATEVENTVKKAI